MKRVAVIGGGVSGLATALTLSKLDGDFQVTLLEASDRVGGVLETIHDGPYMVERSADNFATLIPDALMLSRQCGLEQELIPPNSEHRQAFVLNRGRLLPVPVGFSLMQPTRIRSILGTSTLSWYAKLRLLGEFWIPARESEEDESLESFATRRLGVETFENLVEPIVSGIFTANPATLSMKATMPQFVEMERRYGGLIRGHLAARKKDAAAAARRASGARYDQFRAPREGMSHWLAGLTAELPDGCLQLNTRVVEVSNPTDSQGRSSWSLQTNRGTMDFDAVVCALPAAATAELFQETIPQAAAIVGDVPYASSAVVAMIVNRADLKGRIDGFGLIAPRKEGRPTLAISYTSNKYPGRVPEGEILLRVFLGGALSPHMLDHSDAELIEIATEELRAILGWQERRANWQAVIRWKESMPQYVVGHAERMQQLETVLRQHPTVKLCGAAYSGVGIPQCVRSGRKAAEELADNWSEQ